MSKRLTNLFIALLVLTFTFSSNLSFVEASASNSEKIRKLEEQEQNLKYKTDKVEQDKREINQKMDKNQKEQSSLEKKLASIEEELVGTRADIQSVNTSIDSTEKEINRLEGEIDQLHDEIDVLEGRIEERNKVLKNRLRSIQERGGKSRFLSVLFGAQDFTDFIMRSTAVNTIMDQDRSIMEEHQRDQLALADKKVEVETKKSEVVQQREKLEKKKNKLESLKAQLDEQKAEQSRLKKELEAEYAELEEYELTLEEQKEIYEKEAEAIKKLKALAEEEMLQVQQSSSSSSFSSNQSNKASIRESSGGSKVINNNKPTGNGVLLKPVNASVNSGFRTAERPNHKGVDIAAPTGTPVYAAESGIVTKVVTGCPDAEKNRSCGSGFGNHIYITHLINGRKITTVYAHLSSVKVSPGTKVSRGQVIGTVGNTGNSSGSHLHFEVHEGGFDGHSSARNPEHYF